MTIDNFDSLEICNLHYNITQYILPRLKVFKESTYSYPNSLTLRQWIGILDKMIYAFEYASKDEIALCDSNEYKQYQEGIALFSQYFLNLWI